MISALEQDLWQVRLDWAEKRPDHPLAPMLREAAKLVLGEEVNIKPITRENEC